MSARSSAIDNPLDSAIRQLRSLCDDRGLLESSMDAGSVRRMLVHLTNINSAVLASTRDHVNAAKRLNDFTFTLARIARNTVPPNDRLTTLMRSVADHLRVASEELAHSEAIPSWGAPATTH